MPEMKRNFTGGKMNKDLDERLVPKGEYRDAMNVQVSTSDDNDVGTLQNLLGNTPGCVDNTGGKNPFGVPETSFTVGSISDEKNDTLYWLVSGQDLSQSESGLYSVDWSQQNISLKDMIVRKTSQRCEPVFVDKFAFATSAGTNNKYTKSLVNLDSDVIDTVDPGWTVTGMHPNGLSSNTVTISKVSGKNQTPFDYEYIPNPPQVNPVLSATRAAQITSFTGIFLYLLNQLNLLELFLPLLAKIISVSSDLSLAMSPPVSLTTNNVSFTGRLIINPNGGNVIPPDWVIGSDIHIATSGGVFGVSGKIGEIGVIAGGKYSGLNYIIIHNPANFGPGGTPIALPSGHGFHGNLIFGEKDGIVLDEVLQLSSGFSHLLFQGPRTLNFNHGQLVTGLNIIDDMLFWTDNNTEPKKINISRSISGTHFSGKRHTFLQNENQGYGPLGGKTLPVREKHITVIKKSPKNILSLELITERDESLMYSGIMNTTDDDPVITSDILKSSNPTIDQQGNFGGIQIGDTIRFEIDTDINSNNDFYLEWDAGDILLLREFEEDGGGNSIMPQLPLLDWSIRGKITSWANAIFQKNTSAGIPARVEIEVLGVNGTPPVPDNNDFLQYVVDLETRQKPIFELKFPRFSYRYKYQDGEYSTFAPWSDVAFLPGGFNYDPKEGWNTGMVNRAEKIKLKNFVAQDIPEDVESVDILYKEEGAPNIYIVETITPLDDVIKGQTSNNWNSNEYTITSETVKATLASNQMLRPWDNVPTKALGQEISGNRIIYGNYTHGYDLSDDPNIKYKPDFKNSLEVWGTATSASPGKSIKSLRDYKLGVVFTDKYGRETPILTNESGGFKVDKLDSVNANRLKVGLRGDAPANMTYYKFYIKETSSEYYNLPMDRWYNAEDGNIWLAFPSSDRNKVDIDTTLFLKKSDLGGSTNTNKYKILAIESEAPRFIKTKKLNIGNARQNSQKLMKDGVTAQAGPPAVAAVNPIYGQVFGSETSVAGSSDLDGAPIVDTVSFSLNYIAGGFGSSSVARLDEIQEDLFIHFTASGMRSNQYKVSEITSNRGNDLGSPIPTSYFISVEEPFKEDIDIIYDNPTTPSKVKDGVSIEFTKEIVQESPKFDGRFFAKIQNDGVIKSDIETGITTEYMPVAQKMVYMMPEDAELKKVAKESNKCKSYIELHPPTSTYNNPSVQPNTKTKGTSLINYITEDFYSNPITKFNWYPWPRPAPDFGINPVTGADEWPKHFPYEINETYRVFNARQSFFGKLNTSIEYSEGALAIATMATEYPNGGKAHQVTTDYVLNDKPGVWFIDKSTHKYSRWSDKSMYWASEDFNKDDPSKPLSEHWQLHNKSISFNPGVGGGIVHQGSRSVINLALGGIYDDTDFRDHGFFLIGMPLSETWWDIGGTNSVFEAYQGKFTRSLQSGFKFRWKEDPTGTVYTITGGVDTSQKVRFAQAESYAGGKTGEGTYWENRFRSNNSIADTHTMKNMIKNPSNYHKSWRLKVEPPLKWDPVGGGVGSIIKDHDGNTIGNHIGDQYQTIDFTVDPADDKILVVSGGNNYNGGGFSFSNIKTGMKVWAVDSSGSITCNRIVDEILSGDSIRLNGNIQNKTIGQADVGFTIRCFSSNITPAAGEYYSIVVDNDNGECRNNKGEDTYPLHPGMQLRQYNKIGDPTPVSSVNNNAIIKDIIPCQGCANGEDGYRITLAGYEEPIRDGEFATADFNFGETVVFRQVTMNGASDKTEENTDNMNDPATNEGSRWDSNKHGIAAVGYTMEIVEEVEVYEDGGVLPQDPFVWETEPKENTELDIYYEISDNNPVILNSETIKTAVPIGSVVTAHSSDGWSESEEDDILIVDNISGTGDIITTSVKACIDSAGCPDPLVGTLSPLQIGSLLRIKKPNGIMFSVEINDIILDLPSDSTANKFKIDTKLLNANYRLNWHNCYSFGNGVESNRIRDNFNLPFILNGIKASTTTTEDYQEELRKYGLIYSGIYNSTSGVNNLNQFIAAEKITKDINPIYGSIQKLHGGWGQGGDLIALCEDRVLKILANKDALFNADGNSNVTATNKVLGTATPYSGEFGISTNPESFAAESYRAYFSDKVRGTIMRLSMDGLTPISDHGMRDWFRDNLKISKSIVGSYDDKKSEYNITLEIDPSLGYASGGTSTTVTFSESVKGWVSFKSFLPENGISCANEYYTFKNGKLWRHHHEVEGNANTFYNIHVNSTVDIIFNDMPSVIKSFKTLNYEGSQARVITPLNTTTFQVLQDNEYHNLKEYDGWYVDRCDTHCEIGKASDFIEKECKWFSYLVGNNVQYSGRDIVGNFETSDFNIQGIGMAASITPGVSIGCTDKRANNFDRSAEFDDGSCVYRVFGCTNSKATNYNPAATVDDESCIIRGCMNQFQGGRLQDYGYQNINYDELATINDGSCIPAVAGCHVEGSANYNPSANVSCGHSTGYTDNGMWLEPNHGFGRGIPTSGVGPDYCCNATLSGCTDRSANNWNSNATIDDGSCRYTDCTDENATNYCCGFDSVFNIGSVDSCSDCCQVVGCKDPAASNYNPVATHDCDGCCLACVYGCMDVSAQNYDPKVTCDDGSCITAVFGCMDPLAINNDCTPGNAPPCSDGVTFPCDGCCIYPILGCMDPLATNYDPAATVDDNSCTYRPDVSGCTDILASNYDPLATTNDGSCIYDSSSWGCPTGTVTVVNNPNLTSGKEFQLTINTTGTFWAGKVPSDYILDNSTVNTTAQVNPIWISPLIVVPNDIDANAWENPMETTWHHSNWQTTYSGSTITGATMKVDVDMGCPNNCRFHENPPSFPDVIGGFNIHIRSNAQTAGLPACDNPLLSPSDPCYPITNLPSGGNSVGYATCLVFDDASFIAGCTDPLATGYDPAAQINDGSCNIVSGVSGCTDSDGSASFANTGFIYNYTACNYNPNATTDDGTCEYTSCVGCTDDIQLGPGLGTQNLCTDPSNTTYYTTNPFTGLGNCVGDNTTCQYKDKGCTDPTANNQIQYMNSIFAQSGITYANHPQWTFVDDGSCTYDVLGCTDPTACNYDVSATLDDGSCNTVYGCMDPLYDEYDSSATCSDPTACITLSITGCTDPLANNYDSSATSDDGSCSYDVPGCTDPAAINYNSSATVDDGSCAFSGVTAVRFTSSSFRAALVADPSNGVQSTDFFTPANETGDWLPTSILNTITVLNLEKPQTFGNVSLEADDFHYTHQGNIHPSFPNLEQLTLYIWVGVNNFVDNFDTNAATIFPNLISLDISRNGIIESSFNFGNLPNTLTTLKFAENTFAAFDVSDHANNLEYIDFQNNDSNFLPSLVSVDLSNMSVLETIYGGRNDELSSLDLTNCTSLKLLDLNRNSKLGVLDLSTCNALEEYYHAEFGEDVVGGFSSNSLTFPTGAFGINTSLFRVQLLHGLLVDELDLSGLAGLTQFVAGGAEISKIKANNGNNANLTSFSVGLDSNYTDAGGTACIQTDSGYTFPVTMSFMFSSDVTIQDTPCP